MARLAAGDRSVVESVYGRLDGPVRRLCARMLGAGPDAEDAAQEALVELFGKVSEYDPSRDALAWAFTIAAWECRTLRRKRQRARTTPLEGDAFVGGSDPEAALDERQIALAFEEAVGALRSEDRAVLDQVLSEVRGDAAFRKRKERMLDRLRALVRRTYDLDL